MIAQRLLVRAPAQALIPPVYLTGKLHRAAETRLMSNEASHAESEEGATRAQLVAIEQETPTVKRFTLAVDRTALSFLPGQWVDLFAPGVPQVGGYSFISTPADLQRAGTFQLAVKRSDYPPAAWLHDKARLGDWVQVRPGGSFHYQPRDEARPLLLLAGGIGITPLHSILRHCWQLVSGTAQQAQQPQQAQHPPHADVNLGAPPTAAIGVVEAAAAAAAPCQQLPSLHATLLYSASTPQELALLKDLWQLHRESQGAIQLQLRATSPEWKLRDAEWDGRWGRFTRDDVQAAVESLLDTPPLSAGRQLLFESGPGKGRSINEQEGRAAWAEAGSSGSGGGSGGSRNWRLEEVLAFVCGPPGMLSDALRHLQAAGLSEGQIRYEKWW